MAIENKYGFKVADMSCGHCVKTITKAILDVFPSADITTDLATHHVVVSGAPDKTKLEKIILDAGYTPEAL